MIRPIKATAAVVVLVAALAACDSTCEGMQQTPEWMLAPDIADRCVGAMQDIGAAVELCEPLLWEE